MSTPQNPHTLHLALVLHEKVVEDLELRDYLRECREAARVYKWQQQFREASDGRRASR